MEADLTALPGAEIVLDGIDDARRGRVTVNSLSAQLAATRLRNAGIEVPLHDGDRPAAHALYELLASELGDAAHSRYNAILTRVASFATAAERAQRG